MTQTTPEPFYVTTPIYYVTDAPHIGHLYCTVAADILARYHRLLNAPTHFLTGTDEHGQKIEKKAKETGETPQALADRVVERYRTAWKLFDITYDDFIRTTETRHKKVVTELIQRLMKTGDIYLGSYEGWYCVPDETYWTESQVIEGKCPDCGRPVEKLKEESYFFKMSAFQSRLEKHIEQHPEFIQPESRKNEVLGFIRQGLKDISISRTTIQWGIPMPNDAAATKEHKVYVWFDALTNYISALGYLEKNPLFDQYWSHAIHIVGKDILRFHAVYWPTFLMALGLPLPKQIVAHGWLTIANQKMSKSLGNVVDPIGLAEKFGVEGIRYFLFREFVFGLDGEYTEDSVYLRLNADLANDYGNCVSRVTSMMIKYLGEGEVSVGEELRIESAVKKSAEECVPLFHSALDNCHFHKSLEAIWSIIGHVNRAIETEAPWNLAKSSDPKDVARLKQNLLHWHEALRMSSLLLLPFLPVSAAKALDRLGIESEDHFHDAFQTIAWGSGPKRYHVKKGEPLFPRWEKEPKDKKEKGKDSKK